MSLDIQIIPKVFRKQDAAADSRSVDAAACELIAGLRHEASGNADVTDGEDRDNWKAIAEFLEAAWKRVAETAQAR